MRHPPRPLTPTATLTTFFVKLNNYFLINFGILGAVANDGVLGAAANEGMLAFWGHEQGPNGGW